ncbi:MAG TPA: hypothetical protein PLO51_00440, partial [Candidatus Micrarchaeota archaeon]|nr:hypothetical protein [Candidatus Micrarchaeota archaeon]
MSAQMWRGLNCNCAFCAPAGQSYLPFHALNYFMAATLLFGGLQWVGARAWPLPWFASGLID